MTGLKSPKEYLHDVLQKWGKGGDLEDAPSKWTGVTCADNGDITKLGLQSQNLTGDARCYVLINNVVVTMYIIH